MAPSLSRLAAFLLATLAWLTGALNQSTYFRPAVELPPLLIVLSFLVPATSLGFGGGAGGDIVPSVTAVPEPGTWICGTLTLAAFAYTQRRRLRQLLGT